MSAGQDGDAVIRGSRGRGLGPWGRWALGLFAVATISTASAFVLPWWEVRGTDGSSSTLYYGNWCNAIDTGRYAGSECFAYTESPPIPLPGTLVSALFALNLLVAASVLSLAIWDGGLRGSPRAGAGSKTHRGRLLGRNHPRRGGGRRRGDHPPGPRAVFARSGLRISRGGLSL